jgi:hypothetical protein
VSATDSTIIGITITTDDLNALKRIEGLATAETTSWITLDAGCLEDMSANGVLALADGNALKAEAFTPDTTDPNMQQYELDMNTGTIKFTFDETVDVSTFEHAVYGARFSAEIHTRGCHWFPRRCSA